MSGSASPSPVEVQSRTAGGLSRLAARRRTSAAKGPGFGSGRLRRGRTRARRRRRRGPCGSSGRCGRASRSAGGTNPGSPRGRPGGGDRGCARPRGGRCATGRQPAADLPARQGRGSRQGSAPSRPPGTSPGPRPATVRRPSTPSAPSRRRPRSSAAAADPWGPGAVPARRSDPEPRSPAPPEPVGWSATPGGGGRRRDRAGGRPACGRWPWGRSWSLEGCAGCAAAHLAPGAGGAGHGPRPRRAASCPPPWPWGLVRSDRGGRADLPGRGPAGPATAAGGPRPGRRG